MSYETEDASDFNINHSPLHGTILFDYYMESIKKEKDTIEADLILLRSEYNTRGSAYVFTFEQGIQDNEACVLADSYDEALFKLKSAYDPYISNIELAQEICTLIL